MAKRFDKSDEFGGFTIESSDTGFIVEYHAHNEGDIDDIKILVPYGTWGFNLHTDLNALHDEIATKGEVLADLAMKDSKIANVDRTVEVIDEGFVIGSGTRRGPAKGAEVIPIAPPPPDVTPISKLVGRRRGWGKKEAAASWYTFSIKKGDAVGYGKAHDLFTTMWYTHGVPEGMALWVKSGYATGESMFFVQIPEGLNVAGDDLFREFPLTECASPSRPGLSLLVGDRRSAAA